MIDLLENKQIQWLNLHFQKKKQSINTHAQNWLNPGNPQQNNIEITRVPVLLTASKLWWKFSAAHNEKINVTST